MWTLCLVFGGVLATRGSHFSFQSFNHVLLFSASFPVSVFKLHCFSVLPQCLLSGYQPLQSFGKVSLWFSLDLSSDFFILLSLFLTSLGNIICPLVFLDPLLDFLVCSYTLDSLNETVCVFPDLTLISTTGFFTFSYVQPSQLCWNLGSRAETNDYFDNQLI